jgi:hypothetical protein
LTQQSGEPSGRQHKANILLGPFLLGQEHRDVRTKGRQRPGKKQIDGVKAA